MRRTYYVHIESFFFFFFFFLFFFSYILKVDKYIFLETHYFLLQIGKVTNQIIAEWDSYSEKTYNCL